MNIEINNIYKGYMDILKNFIGNDTTFGDDLKRKGKYIFGYRFKGVFSSDNLPKDIKNRDMYIANLDKSTGKGSHWISVYKQNDKLYVYDSFGRPSKRIIKSLVGQGIDIQDTQYDAEQSKRENNCGLRAFSALFMFDNHDAEVVAKYL